VTQTVACLISGCELSWFSMCTLLVTPIVACLVSEGELAWFFNMFPSGDRDCGLSCFRR
jgi:hypothetical protein